ncbi:MAG: hypothetical protein DIU71_05035 [Proteobacteria bacterium]|nr:MAG: hypothetical protein DIU71_05035 [Pseudomonadota bacterium]
MNRESFPGKVVRLPASVKTVPPESARALESAWRRRWNELRGWQPSGGWLVEPAGTDKDLDPRAEARS